MKTFTIRALIVVAALSSAAGLALARSTTMVELGRQSVVTTDGKALTTDAVRKAIISGGAVHTWHVVSDKPGVLTLEADSGSHQAVVDVSYDAQGYQITYKSSANLNYAHSDKKDVDTIHPKYNKWIEDLSSSIRSALLVTPTPGN